MLIKDALMIIKEELESNNFKDSQQEAVHILFEYIVHQSEYFDELKESKYQ